jgi:hypothetical protein
LKGYNVDYTLTDQVDYWKKINGCLVSVHVPGFNNNILDRAQLQLMGFGCCTISPKLPELLPGYVPLVPGTHYLECKGDYSDIPSIIDWCKSNRDECIDIGLNAKGLFMNHCTPEVLTLWIKECISEK